MSFLRKLSIMNINRQERVDIVHTMKKNGIPDVEVEGEKAFIKKWSKLGSFVDPVYYRCFSKYVGNNENIVSGNLCVEYIEPILNPIRYRDLYEDKNMFGKILPRDILPTTILRRMNGIFMDKDYNVIDVNESNIFTFLNSVDKFIVKPSVDSSSGHNVSLFHKEGDVYLDQNNSVFSWNLLNEVYGKDFIIEYCIEQSAYMSQFNSDSINTIRMTAYRSVKDNKIHITNCIVRIGAKHSVVDNAHSGGRFCGVDKNGKLNNYVGETYGETMEVFNGIDFKNSVFVIPDYDKIKQFAIKVVEKIPHHRLIALDIALDKNNNPLIVEYNIGGFGYWVFQYAGQVCLDGFTDEIIDYCAGCKKYTMKKVSI